MRRKIPDDPWAMTPGYSLCPDCGEPLEGGTCPVCGMEVEIPPIPAWWPSALLGVLVLLTALFTLILGDGLPGVGLALAGACCVTLAGCVVWFWASFRYGLDKRPLLYAVLTTMGLFVLDMLVAALCAVIP